MPPLLIADMRWPSSAAAVAVSGGGADAADEFDDRPLEEGGELERDEPAAAAESRRGNAVTCCRAAGLSETQPINMSCLSLSSRLCKCL